jgi:hypothetical protein
MKCLFHAPGLNSEAKIRLEWKSQNALASFVKTKIALIKGFVDLALVIIKSLNKVGYTENLKGHRIR